MRVLWIDDEPSRYKILIKAADAVAIDREAALGYRLTPCAREDIVFAHGFDQINHYLTCGTI
jgi:hypothetical protein